MIDIEELNDDYLSSDYFTFSYNSLITREIDGDVEYRIHELFVNSLAKKLIEEST